ncbi:hypothetical protein IQ277_07520 [Nostocales cyanobacterium LEGE 12452]|nr:hypothetical protein [Nostocales cyanobacterium LEGE 12452]
MQNIIAGRCNKTSCFPRQGDRKAVNTVRLRQETAIYRVFVMIYGIFSDLEFSSKNLNRTVLEMH